MTGHDGHLFKPGDPVEVQRGDATWWATVAAEAIGTTHNGRGIYVERTMNRPDGSTRVGPHWVPLDRVRRPDDTGGTSWLRDGVDREEWTRAALSMGTVRPASTGARIEIDGDGTTRTYDVNGDETVG